MTSHSHKGIYVYGSNAYVAHNNKNDVILFWATLIEKHYSESVKDVMMTHLCPLSSYHFVPFSAHTAKSYVNLIQFQAVTIWPSVRNLSLIQLRLTKGYSALSKTVSSFFYSTLRICHAG